MAETLQAVPEAVILDFYGLFQPDPQKVFFEKHGFSRVNGFAKASDDLDTGKITYAEYLKQFAIHSGLPLEQVIEEFQGVPLDPLMLELARALGESPEVKFGILTNTSLDETGPILDRYGLYDAADDVVISSEVRMNKPNPEIYKLALGRLGVSPEVTVFADDSPANVATPRILRMIGIDFVDSPTLVAQLQGFGIELPGFEAAPSGLHVPIAPPAFARAN